jgi:hypothetical protein
MNMIVALAVDDDDSSDSLHSDTEESDSGLSDCDSQSMPFFLSPITVTRGLPVSSSHSSTQT